MAQENQAQTLLETLSQNLNQMVPAEEVQIANPQAEQILQQRNQQIQEAYQESLRLSGKITSSLSSSQNSNSAPANKTAGAPSAPVVDLKELAKTDIHSYVKTIKSTPDFQNLTEQKKKEALDYVYNERVVPFFNGRGENPPPRESLDSTSGFDTAHWKPSKLDRFGVGVAQGAAKTVVGIHNIAETVAQKLTEAMGYDEAAKKIGVTKERFAKQLLTPTQNWFDDYKAESLGEEFAGLGGEMFGQLPAFNAVGSALRTVPIISQMAVGGAAVPISVGKWYPSIRAIAASQLLQKSIFGAIEGATTAPVINDDVKDWAIFGAVSPVALKGIGVLAKPMAYLFAMGGQKAVGGVFEGATKLASVARKLRPTPKSAEEVVVNMTADALDKTASDLGAESYSTASAKVKEKAEIEVINHITDMVRNPDAEVISDLAATQSDLISNVSALAKKSTDEVDNLAKKFNLPTTKEEVAAKAKKDTVRATIENKVTSKPVTETVPEVDETLQSQLKSVIEGNKSGMIVSKSDLPRVGKIPDNVRVTSFQDGTVVISDKKVPVNKIKELKLKNRLNEVTDYPVTKEEVAKAVKEGEEPVVVQSTDPVTGTENSTMLASTSSAVETVEAAQKHFPSGDVTVGGIDSAADVTHDRAIRTFRHSLNNVWQGPILAAGAGLKEEPDKAKLAAALLQARKDGLKEDEIVDIINKVNENVKAKMKSSSDFYEAQKVVDKASKTVQKAKKVEASTSTNVSSRPEEKGINPEVASDLDPAQLDALKILGINPTTKPVTEVTKPVTEATNEEVVKKAKAVIQKKVNAVAILNAEKRDSDIEEATYRRILKSFGYESSKDVVPEDVEKIRSAMLRERFRQPFYETNVEGIYTSDPGSRANKNIPFDEQEFLIRPNVVFDSDTRYNPPFVGKVISEFPDLAIGINQVAESLNAQELFQRLNQKLGPDATEAWLRKNGYDVMIQGRPGKGDDVLVSVLNKNVVKSNSQKQIKVGTEVAKAIGIKPDVADKAAKAGEISEQEVNDIKKIINPPMIKKYDASGKLISETPFKGNK